MRVLLVDDEEELVSTLAERLTMRGIDAYWVTSCHAAIDLIEHDDFDVAVLDVKLPRMSGLELKRQLSARKPNLKFIFLTGHGSEQDYVEGSAEAGNPYYLVKPVQIEILMKKLTEIFQQEGNS
ncbi:MAG: response regulator [Desulfatirhabdiaceae bacterium]